VSVPENLVSLCKLDQEIWNLKMSLERARAKVGELKKGELALQQRLEEQNTKRKDLELKVREVEAQSAQNQVEQERIDKQALQATSVKMLEASKSKISELDSQRDGLDETWMELSENLEMIVETQARTQEELEACVKSTENEIELLNDEASKGQKELPLLIEGRPEFLDGLTSEILEKYEARRRTDPYGIKILELESENCASCAMQLTLRIYELIRYNSEIHTCPHCGVIVYWGE